MSRRERNILAPAPVEGVAVGVAPLPTVAAGGLSAKLAPGVVQKQGFVSVRPTLRASVKAGVRANRFGTVSGGVVLPPVIATPVVPDATIGEAFSLQLTAAGIGVTWSLASGSLPDGLSLSAAGLISGTPTTEETAVFTVRASNAGGSDTEEITIAVAIDAAGLLAELYALCTLIASFPRGSTIPYTTAAGSTVSGDGDTVQAVACEVAPGGAGSRFTGSGASQTFQNNATDDLKGAGVFRNAGSSNALTGTGSNANANLFFSQTLWWLCWHGRLSGTSTSLTVEFFRSDANNGRLDLFYQPSTGTLRVETNDGTTNTQTDYVIGNGEHRIALYHDGADLHVLIDNEPLDTVVGVGALGVFSAGPRLCRGTSSREVDFSEILTGLDDDGDSDRHLLRLAAWVASKAA
ncbi:MAG: putative Ig domain-containing protein [Planctomycetota bacterium]|nr:putative Ig domain-containing protein [Planctomycetota bacterium]